MNPFVLFGFSHNVVLAFSLITSILIALLVRNNSNYNNLLRYSIASSLLLQNIIFFGWHFFNYSFKITEHLPLHLCTISLYLVVFALITESKFITNLVYFWSPISILITLILPDLNNDFPSFRFIEFFWSHVFILFGLVYLIFNKTTSIKYKDLWTNFTLLFVYMLLVYPINLFTKGNYLYLINKPIGGQMNFLPKEPYHILGLIVLTIVVFHLEFIVIKWIKPKLR